MLGAQLAELRAATPPGVGEALDLVTGFDDCLVHGLARVGAERAAALAALAGAVAATPLGDRVGEAVEKIIAGSVAGEHLTALASGRAALLGAVHDALLARLDAALGRTRAEWADPPAPGPAAPDNLLTGCRSWLYELAITGWRGVDHDLVSASGQVIEAVLAPGPASSGLRSEATREDGATKGPRARASGASANVIAEPRLRRLAVLLDGLAAELRASCPVATMERLPVRRWADLWSRAVLLSQPGSPATGSAAGPAAAGAGQAVSGRLLILGVDVHEHGTAVQVQVHGVLEPTGGAPARLVRTSVAAAKVDTIVGTALWRLLRGYPVLLHALTEHRSLDIADLLLLDSGDLVWQDDRASAGEPADPFATARIQLTGALAPAVPPLHRHPVRIGEPVLVEGYKSAVDDRAGAVTLDLGGHHLAVDVDRLPTCGPLTPELVAASSACVGLIRWDGGEWRLQPLAVQATVKRKPVAVHNGDWAQGPTDPKVVAAEAKAGDAVAVLRERAGRLLRR